MIALPSTTDWSAAIVAALIVALILGLLELLWRRKHRSALHTQPTVRTPKPRRRLKLLFDYERIDVDAPTRTDGAGLDQPEGHRQTAPKLEPQSVIDLPTTVTRPKE